MSRRPSVRVGPTARMPEDRVVAPLRRRLVQARLVSREGQRSALVAVLGLTVLVFCGSAAKYDLMPLTTFLIPLLIGSLVLRMKQFAVVVVVVLVCMVALLPVIGFSVARASAVTVTAVYSAIAMFEVARRRSGLPATLGEATLVDLRDRIAQGAVVPEVPRGWTLDQELRAADGAEFAGDFVVATLDDEARRLELVMVDVSGKGVDAGTRALQLSGAFGGLLGAVTPERFLHAANAYVMRQGWVEGFATAAHVEVDLVTGDYVVRTAGHPPVLQWHQGSGRWTAPRSSGPALGLVRLPDFDEAVGHLRHGDALVAYTDGLVESRTTNVDLGIDRLIGRADRMVVSGFATPAATLLDVAGEGDDDRAVVVLRRA